MQTVKSSNIDAIGHDGERLRIRFKNGSVYEYSDVSEEEFDALVHAESIGKHFAALIRNTKPARRVSAEELAKEQGEPELVLDGEIAPLPENSDAAKSEDAPS